ncbi:MAG: single-stranded-DNA-specific exonuclease RecJ, partial [Burkholderiales bacterium]
ALAIHSQVWGQGFPAPLFCDRFRVENQRVVKEKHLRLKLWKDGRPYHAILFSHCTPLPDEIQAAYRMEASEYGLQLIVESWNGIERTVAA